MHLRLLIQTEHFSCIQPYSIRLFNLICGLFHIFSIISTNISVFYTLILEIAYPVTRNRLSQLRQFPFLVRIIVMTDTENKTPAKKKGGARPGAGRKPLIGAKTTTVILTEDLLIQLKRLGGSSWIRSQLQPRQNRLRQKLQMMFSIRSPSLQKRSLWKRPPIIQWIEPEFMREPFFFSERKQKPRSAISFFLNTQGKKHFEDLLLPREVFDWFQKARIPV